MKKICIFFACLVLLGVNLVHAQTVRITGTVTGSQDGLSIPGVSVLAKGSTVGMITDIDGKYALNVPSDAKTLVFSFVGMKTQEVQIGGREIINVVLESESLQVEELVVTALGIKREKKALGYSVQDVKGSDLNKASNPNLVTALSGKIAGVEIRQSSGMPGAPSQVFIRGARSFSGNNEPLYVVDGMPIQSSSDYDGSMSGGTSGSGYSSRALDIDPNDIESVNVLKGQAASALYGLRASNGVILITTKSGKNNEKGKPVVNITSSFGWDKISRLPDLQMKYAQGIGSFAPVNSFSWGPLISELPNDPIYGGNSQGHSGQFFHPQKNAWVDAKAINSAKKFFDTGNSKNTSVNVSQAGSFGNYSIGFGSTNQKGIIMSTGMERYTAKASGAFNVTEKWKAGFSSNYSDSKLDKLPSGNDSWLFTVYGCPPSYDLMGTPYHVPNGLYSEYRQLSYRRGTVGENPLWATKNNKFTEQTKRFFGNAWVEYNPLDWINIKYQAGVDTYTTDLLDQYEMGSSQSQFLPTAAYLPTPNDPTYKYIEPTGGSINSYGVNRRIINSLLNISFQRNITEDIKAIAIVGNEINDNQGHFHQCYGTGFSTPGWHNLANTNTQTASESHDWNRTFGFYGSLALEYKSILFFNATSRNDVVSSMPRGNRSFFYPSVSLGFVFTELKPLKNNKILNFGKVRLSYAEVGMADIYQKPVYVVDVPGSGMLTDGLSYPLGQVSGYRPSSRLYDSKLKPQNTKSTEFGLELKFLNNRVSIDYTYSNQVTVDQIFNVPLAGSTGYSQVKMNAGEMSSKSNELMLTVIPIQAKDFEWSLTTNFTKIKNVCEELAPGVENISLGGYTTPNIRASAGDTYPAIYGERFARDEKGRILVDEDGLPYAGEFAKIGEVSPDFMLGFNNMFRYKFITLSAQIDWKSGGDIYSGSNYLIDLYGTSKKTLDREKIFIYDGYKADGTKNDIEINGKDAEGNPNATSYDLYTSALAAIPESHVYDASFVKLREVSLSVNLPKKVIAKAHLQNASISFSARNILLWTNLPNFDPETSQGQGNMSGGMDYMSLPQTKSYSVGLNLTF